MTIKQFKDILVGDRFSYNGNEYTRIEDERVSCCRVNNACLAYDTNVKINIQPLTEVEVNDQL